MKKFLLIILFFLVFNQSSGKTPFEIKLHSEYYKFFKIILTTGYLEAVKINSEDYPFIKESHKDSYKDSVNFSDSNVLEVYYSRDGISWSKAANYFDCKRTEKRIYFEISFHPNEDKLPYCMINVYRYYKGRQEIRVLADWDEKKYSVPKYKLINNSNEKFYGINDFNEFWGILYKFNNDKWEVYSVGGRCATSYDGPPLHSGDTVVSKLADYRSGYDDVKSSGKFKYVVQLTLTNELCSIFRRIDNTTNIYDIYEIEQFFEIK